MPLPGDLTSVTVTGQFTSASGQPITGRVTFTPSATLLDPTSSMVIPAAGAAYPLSASGSFQSDPLIATDNEDLEPQGWAYTVLVELQDLAPYTFQCFLPSSPSTVDISALEPVFPAGQLSPAVSGGGNYLPAGGGTETGTLVLDATPPLKVPGSASGYVLVSDGNGNFTAQPNPAGSATSIDGVTVSGTPVQGRTIIVGSGGTTATWTLPLQVDTSAGDIQALAASAGAGSLTQAAAADHVHPSTGLVDTSSTQTIAGSKTFSGEVIVPSPPVNPGDAVPKSYADGLLSGLTSKFAAVAATVGTETFTVSGGTVTQIAGTTLDGQSPAVNDQVLIKDAPAATGTGSAGSSEPGNGLYYVSNNTTNLSVSRVSGMSGANSPVGAFVFVEAGTANKGAGYVVTTPAGSGSFTYGSGAIQFTQFSASGTLSADGTTLSQSGSTISLITPVTIAHGGTGVNAASTSQNAVFAGPASGSGAPSFRALAGTDLPAATTSAQGAIELGGGTTNFLRADGSWQVPPGSGGASLDTSDNPQPLGAASPGTSTEASPANHVHPTTGLLLPGAFNSTVLTALEQATGGGVLTGLAGAATSGQYLRGSGSTIGLSAIQAADLPAATTSVQGAVTLDGTVGDIKASPGTAAIGSAGKAADASHVHGQPNTIAPTGLPGATTASRYVGGVHSASPASGTFALGDFVVDNTGSFWICTTAGTVGSGAAFTHLLGGTGLTNVMTTVGDTIYGGTVTGGAATPTRLALGTAGQVLSAATPAGTTTPALTWNTPSPDWINVKTQFGAYGDGSHDDTTAIQNALNALPASGGTVYFPGGVYMLKSNAPLTIPSGTNISVTLLGPAGTLAAKIQTNSTTADVIYASNCKGLVMSNLQVQGAGTGSTGIGIHLQSTGGASSSTAYVDISDCSVYGTGGDGIKIDNPLNVTVRRCTVTNVLGNGFNMNGLVGGTSNPGTSTLIENCYATNPAFAGYVLNGIHYSAVIATATDGGTAGYVLTNCQHFTMVSPGCEAPVASKSGITSPYSGQGYEISGGIDVTVISPLLRLNPSIAYWVTGNSVNTMLISPAEISQLGTQTASVQVDAGSYCTVIRPYVLTAPLYNGTVVGVAGVSATTNSAASGYTPDDLFNVDTAGKAWWGSGAAAVDTNLYRSAANVLKTDDSLTVGTNLAVTGSASVDGTFLSNPQPGDLNLLAWAWDPGICNGSTTALGGSGAVGAGIVYLIRIPLYGQSLSTTGVRVSLGTVGSGLTSGENFCYLFNSSGTFIAATADQTANWNTGATLGAVDAPWASGPFTVSGSFCWVGLVYNGTTGPSLLRGSVLTAGMANGRLTADLSRYGSWGTGKTTAAPGNIPTPLASNITQHSVTFWAALY